VASDLEKLGELIKNSREQAGWSVRQLGDAAGLVPSTVFRLEKGLISAPRPNHLRGLAAALKIDVEELYVEAGYLPEDALPELRPYLRAKYGLTDQQTDKIESYLQGLRDANQPPGKEGQNDTDEAP
jgi:transcriptional regulator with XRE-family HTH domain